MLEALDTLVPSAKSCQASLCPVGSAAQPGADPETLPQVWAPSKPVLPASLCVMETAWQARLCLVPLCPAQGTQW